MCLLCCLENFRTCSEDPMKKRFISSSQKTGDIKSCMAQISSSLRINQQMTSTIIHDYGKALRGLLS